MSQQRKLSTANRKELTESFNKYDNNKNGYLEESELMRLFKNSGYSDEYAQAFIKKFDTNKDNKISYFEFMEACENKKS
ncbi:hypothetical protein Ciccas_007752 [Cichlidogyrus casuarinus]|uniref:EF-hand domain-containing protein n=1 Tax=Cichlidogyrus casuarinus TaxID=1844966 RepID=A0ABD2Q1Z0_9PLAT